MKQLKAVLGLCALLVGLAAVEAGPASATTLEIGGVAQNKSVSYTGSLKSRKRLVQTGGPVLAECLGGELKGQTEGSFTGASVGGALSTLAFSSCTHTVHTIARGSLSFSHISGTTNATVTSSGLEMTVVSTTFGLSHVCKTGTGTDIGVLTGASIGTSTLDVQAALNCGFFSPSVIWETVVVITAPSSPSMASTA